MFAKLAQIRLRGVGSVRRAWAADAKRAGSGAACCSAMAETHKARRPILVCHWQHAPATGALECVWQSIPAPVSDEPRPKRELGQIRRLTDARTARRRPFRRGGLNREVA
jgi:hypothetical protein